MTLASRSLGARLSALHAASFVGFGVYLPFFPVWLETKVSSPTMIGIVLAIPIVVRILVTAPLLALADRNFGPRRLLIASHLGQILGYPVLMLLDEDLAIAAVVALLAIAQAAVIPGNDLVTTNALRRRPDLHYGRIRGFGSIAFLGTSIAAGYLIDARGAGIVLWVLALAPFLGILATLLALPPGMQPRAEPGPRLSFRKRVRLPRALWLVMIAAACAQASHAGIYAFGSIHWRAIGFSDASIGYLWAVGVVAEILVFVLLGRAVGRGSAGLHLLLIGCGAAALRFAALSVDPGLAATFFLQALHGLSFGASHLGAMAALSALAPDEGRGRAQGLLGSVVALGTAAATVVSGPIYRAAGPAVFAAMAPLGIAGLLLTFLAIRSLKGQPQRAGDGG